MDCGSTVILDSVTVLSKALSLQGLTDEEVMEKIKPEIVKFVAKVEYCNHLVAQTLKEEERDAFYRMDFMVVQIMIKLLNVNSMPLVDVDMSPDQLEEKGMNILNDAKDENEIINGLAYLYYSDLKRLQEKDRGDMYVLREDDK